MKEILYNYDYLKKEDINNKIDRVKILLVNSKNEILLGFEHNTYQFIGGHAEDDETWNDCIIREVKEETGIEIKDIDVKPFFTIRYFCKNYPNKNENSEFTINYYVIRTDKKINLENTEYTDHEKEGNFELKYVSLDKIEKVLEESVELNKENKVIVPEMLEVLKEYKNQLEEK